MQTDEMLTTKQVAERLGVTGATIRLLAKAGKLPCVKVTDRAYRFPASGLAAFVKARSTGNA